MPQSEDEPLLDALVRDFGANYAFALDLLQEFRRDRQAVDASWRFYFDVLTGVAAPSTAAAPAPSEKTRPAPSAESAAPVDVTPTTIVAPGTSALPVRARPLAITPILPGDIAQPIRGGALRIVENMEASLLVPTATSSRTIPVRALDENRALLNRHRSGTGKGKLSYTHLVAWALLRALGTFPRLNDAYAELEGGSHRVQRDSVRLGIAVDTQKKDGSRTLLVPNIKDAQRLDFPAFVEAYEDLVGRARRASVSPADFMGTTVSLTNPGMLGTTSSTPRLLPGQGLILALGALDYPSEYRSMTPRTLSLLGISKVITVSATYDHRIIQGAESGLFLQRIEELLKGDDGFYQRIFDELGVPHRPVRWEVDRAPALLGAAGSDELVEKQARVLQLINAFRVRGHLVADLDPLDWRREPHRDLDPATYGLTLWDLDREFFTSGLSGNDRATLRETLEVLRDTYCGKVGVEYMFIADPERKEWLRRRMEGSRNRTGFDKPKRRRLLAKLVAAETFERFLHGRYIGHKRFSIEGCEALIPLLDSLLSDAARVGMREAVIGMSHRGRLNVLANTVGKPLSRIFSEFEGHLDPDSVLGSGDVKYHLGAAGTHRADTGETLLVSVAPNPSHLEFVDPVVEGMARAKQDAQQDHERSRVLPILIHGDAAFAGQGVVAETLNLSGLAGYRTGGTIHVVVNNQIGFTTLPAEARSSTYCTDVAKMVQAPVFHVNADDAEAVVHVSGVALEYRQRFKRDVVIDLVGYRRWGHSEGDEPSYTQPLLYAKIKSHPSVAHLYGEQLARAGTLTGEEVEAVWAEAKARLQKEEAGDGFAELGRRSATPRPEVGAEAMWGRLKATLRALCAVPDGFALHPKLEPLLESRRQLLEGRGAVNWATAEALAFGTLLLEGIPVRLSGQDSRRGTFSQRHAVLYDAKTGREHVPLGELAQGGARFEVHDSLLSESAVLGFEYGYTVAEHEALVMWEAQFGDFANAAQVVVDQFLSGSEQKWGQPTDLVLLLPHGYEGQGPEHSSARLERFLILCAEENLRICQPTTPAQYFHLLRRQARDAVEKPLVLLTPKRLLRHPACSSALPELAEGDFLAVLDDHAADPARVRRVVLTSGRLYFDLLQSRIDRRADHLALLRLEQLYPFPSLELLSILERYSRDAELVWAQDEPRNMGAWRYVRERFLDGEVRGALPPSYVGRPESASPAAGSHTVHSLEQQGVLRQVFGD